MADGGGDNGGSGQGNDFLARLEKLLAKDGDRSQVDGTLQELIREQRSEIKTLQGQLRDARAKLPAEDAVVLTAEEAEVLASYKKLGKPEEITSLKEKVGELEGQIAARDGDKKFAEAAQAHGYKAPVLTRLASQDGLEIVEVREEGEGEDQKTVAYVRKDEKEAPVALSAYASEHWGEFMPALQAEASSGGSPAPTGGPRMPRQQGEGRPQPKEKPVQEFIKRRNERAAKAPNPLLRTASGS